MRVSFLIGLTLLFAACSYANGAVVSTTTPIAPATPTSASTLAPSPTTVLARTPALTPTGAPEFDARSMLSVGLNDTWIYQATRYEGFNPDAILTATQVITETVIELKSAPSFFAAKIREETSADLPVYVPKDMETMLRPAASEEYYLVFSGNRVYRQARGPDPSHVGDPDTLEFVFPVKPGDRWVWLPAHLESDPDKDQGIFRHILRVGAAQVPAGRFDNCYLIQDDWVTDTVESWFCPGVGWVEGKSDHNGTPLGSHRVLLAYHLAAARSTAATNSSSEARAMLTQFMQARIARDEARVLNLLTERLRAQLMGNASDVLLLQVSNPCWYRYTLAEFNQPSATQVAARVRVYEHFWSGDNGGGPPRSWEQTVTLVETSAGWRVDQLGAAEDARVELNEPHGPTLSACNVAAATPTPAP